MMEPVTGKYYRAMLIHTEGGYKHTPKQAYILHVGYTHARFYEDQALQSFMGQFPLEWFSEFEEIEPVSQDEDQQQEAPAEDLEQITLF